MAVNFNNFSDGGENISDNSYLVGFSNTNTGGEKKWSWFNLKNVIKRYIDSQFAFPKMLVNFNGTSWQAQGNENIVSLRSGSLNVQKVVRLSKGSYRIYFNTNIPLWFVALANCEIDGDKDETAVCSNFSQGAGNWINVTTYSLNSKADMPLVCVAIFK